MMAPVRNPTHVECAEVRASLVAPTPKHAITSLKLAGMTEVVNSHLAWDVPTLPPATMNTLPQWTQERASILIVRATVSMTPARAVAQVIATILIVWPGKMMATESVTRFVAIAWACTTNAGCAMVQEQF